MRTATVSNSPSKWVVLPHYAFAAMAFLALGVLLLFSTDAFGGHYFHPKLLTGMVFNPVSDPWED